MSNKFTDTQKINFILETLQELVDLKFSVEDFKTLHRQGRLAQAYKMVLELPHPPPPEFVMFDLTQSFEALIKAQKSALENIHSLGQLKKEHELYEQKQTELRAKIAAAATRMEEELYPARAFAQRIKFMIAPPNSRTNNGGR